MRLSRIRTATLVAVAALVATLTGGGPALAEPYPDPIAPFVVGGSPATQLYPGQVSLQYIRPAPSTNTGHTCGALLYDERYVAVSAHCVTTKPADGIGWIPRDAWRYSIRVGSLQHASGGRTYQVEKIEVHPDWNWQDEQGKPDHDFARLTLAIPATGETVARLAPPRFGAKSVKTGWGLLADGNTSLPADLQELPAWRVPLSDCKGNGNFQGRVRDACFASNPGTGICYGDSGTSAYQRRDGQWVAVGLVSRLSAPTCGAGPDIYTAFDLGRIAWLTRPPVAPAA